MRLLIIRHADPEYVGDTLTSDGFLQAEALGRRLSSGLEGVEGWTAELTDWPRLPGPDRLPIWCANRASDPEMAPYADLLSSLHSASDAFLARHGYNHNHARAGTYSTQRPTNRDIIAVFCHGGFGVVWLAYLLQIPIPVAAASFTLLPSSVTTVLFDERAPDAVSPRVIGMGDVGHLYADKLKIPNSKYERKNQFGDHKRPSGIKANFW